MQKGDDADRSKKRVEKENVAKREFYQLSTKSVNLTVYVYKIVEDQIHQGKPTATKTRSISPGVNL